MQLQILSSMQRHMTHSSQNKWTKMHYAMYILYTIKLHIFWQSPCVWDTTDLLLNAVVMLHITYIYCIYMYICILHITAYSLLIMYGSCMSIVCEPWRSPSSSLFQVGTGCGSGKGQRSLKHWSRSPMLHYIFCEMLNCSQSYSHSVSPSVSLSIVLSLSISLSFSLPFSFSPPTLWLSIISCFLWIDGKRDRERGEKERGGGCKGPIVGTCMYTYNGYYIGTHGHIDIFNCSWLLSQTPPLLL